MNFDTQVNRLGSHCVKWDMMQAIYGVAPPEGLAMWVADMEFPPPASVQQALEKMTATAGPWTPPTSSPPMASSTAPAFALTPSPNPVTASS